MQQKKKKLQVAAETLRLLLSVSSRSWLSVPQGTTEIEVETAEVKGSLTEPPLSVIVNLDANALALHEIITSRGSGASVELRLCPICVSVSEVRWSSGGPLAHRQTARQLNLHFFFVFFVSVGLPTAAVKWVASVEGRQAQ